MSDRRRMSRRFDSEKRSEKSRTDGIPVFDLVDLKKNKDFMRLKQDLEERGRTKENRKKEKGPTMEVLYVDATRNVGVVLGKNEVNNLQKNTY